MRIEQVTAVAFGPLTDETLHLAPCLTVVHGPNEAGKSSWHAAIYAAICGQRRARGNPRVDDRAFADRHRPWIGDAWAVSAVLRLDSGRRIELRHDLAARIDSSATDLDLGRDVTGEILSEGAPDGARWLGLDRRSFLAVACVRQADVLSVLQRAGELQDFVQRAAATSGQDATAAQAVERLQAFLAERVGTLRAPTRPLSRAHEEVAAAREGLSRARKQHDAWLELDREAVERRRCAAAADHALRGVRAARARAYASSLQRRLARAQGLAARHPLPPESRPEDDALADRVTASLAAWRRRPEVHTLEGPSAATLRAELAGLPDMPVGDLQVHPTIAAAHARLVRATQELEVQGNARPEILPTPQTGDLAGDRLRELARDLETSVPSIDPTLEAKYSGLSSALARTGSHGRRHRLLAGMAAGALILAVVSLVAGSVALGLVLTVGALGVLIALVVRPPGAARSRVLDNLRTVEQQLVHEHESVRLARERVDGARHALELAGLAADPTGLRRLASESDAAVRQVQECLAWSSRRDDLLRESQAAAAALASALGERGEVVLGEAEAAYAAYAMLCAERARLALRAARRDPLAREIANREAAERAAADARRYQDSARCALLAAVSETGRTSEDPESAAGALEAWRLDRAADAAARDRAREEWSELQALLDGGSLADLESAARAALARARVLCGEFETVPDLPDDALESEEARRDGEARRLEHEAVAAEATARARADGLPSVPEAEERLAQAEDALHELGRLADTLEKAIAFLQAAEERVHRDIAPQLAAGLARWLGRVTSARYRDVTVDPASLAVRVRDEHGEWRDAANLSCGTQEQVYLLLRAVMARLLTTTGERCPLILDDVTVQADGTRKRALLDIIRAISRDQQVVLFTQEDEVLAWARDHLEAPADVLHTLNAPRDAAVAGCP